MTAKKTITRYTSLEEFRSLLLLGGSGVCKTIRMGPDRDPLQGLDRAIKGAKESSAVAYVTQRLLLVGCLYFLSLIRFLYISPF